MYKWFEILNSFLSSHRIRKKVGIREPVKIIIINYSLNTLCVHRFTIMVIDQKQGRYLDLGKCRHGKKNSKQTTTSYLLFSNPYFKQGILGEEDNKGQITFFKWLLNVNMFWGYELILGVQLHAAHQFQILFFVIFLATSLRRKGDCNSLFYYESSPVFFLPSISILIIQKYSYTHIFSSACFSNV